MFGQGKVNFRPKTGTGAQTNMASLKAATATARSHKHHGGPGNGGIAGATIFDSSAKMSYSTICLPAGWFGPIEFHGEFTTGVVGETYNILEIDVILYDGSFYIYLVPNYLSWTTYNPAVISPSWNSFTLVGPGYSYAVIDGTYSVYCAECPGGLSASVEVVLDVTSYGYTVQVTSVDVDELGDGTVSIQADGPYWLSPTLSINVERDGDSPLTLFSGSMSPGSRTVPFLENGVDHMPAADYPILDALYVAGVAAAPIALKVNAVPINFHRTQGVTYSANGDLTLNYAWESSTKTVNNPRLNDLQSCYMFEALDFVGYPDPFVWPMPWNGSYPKHAFLVPAGEPMNSGRAEDTHGTFHFQQPFQTNSFTGHQKYFYQCPMNGSNYVGLSNEVLIERRVIVSPNFLGSFRYEIEKVGEVNYIDPIQ